MTTIRLTAAQALVRAMLAQQTEMDGATVPLFGGVWAIFGHGNVAGLGEALEAVKDRLPTYRAHNEQGMAFAAVAYAKASRRRRLMACTSSIGPGALNMVTAAGVAHVDRMPLLLLPGDVFASRQPDPVLQQVEDFGDGTVSANDCFRPVSRYFDRITRPEQIVPAFERALAVFNDPADCGPATLAFCQDVQAMAADYPQSFFEPRVWRRRRLGPDRREVADAAALLRTAQHPMVIVGGGVLYSEAEGALANFCAAHGLPLGETTAGKSAVPASHPLNLGGVGVMGTEAANALAREADVVLAVGTRLQDFTSGSRALFAAPGRQIIGLNVQPFDAYKHGGAPLVGDALLGIEALGQALGAWRVPAAWTARAKKEKAAWEAVAQRYMAAGANTGLPTDAQVVGVVQRQLRPGDVVLNAAGGLPADLQKLFRTEEPLGYHLEYGFSCMGYEIAGGLGAALALPERNVIVMVGDGSYLMLNSEIATSVLLGRKLTVVVLDNHGFGCINRLQQETGGEQFNNLLQHTLHATLPGIDFAAHARALGAMAERVASLGELEAALARARQSPRTCVIAIDTDPARITDAGGAWWEVAVAEVSPRQKVHDARANYEQHLTQRSEIA